MGNFYTRMISFIFPNIECRCLMLGLDGAGKTTVLYKMKLDETVNTVPTVGFNVETLTFKKLTITVWDVGGQQKIRGLWKYYFANTTALVFVVDSSDFERFEEAKEELHKLLAEPELRDAHLLVLANKMDMPNSKDSQEIINALELKKVKRDWFVTRTNAKTGEGLTDGLMWLKDQLKA
ncbi:unnamed protein product [Caenorhabditis angaria]|uniref:Uncharacterized protein n=1 Tax=Caenorhabditis angaria TaxID=860376 RepID=A0A9P1IR63_9PELO|nr:unnamed protein product [Caenorhabditis angaria]